MIDAIKLIAYLIAIIMIVSAVVFVPVIAMGASACDQWAAMNPEHTIQWKFPIGCLYKTPNGLWLQSENVIYANGDLILVEGKE
jgi:hypothetical protein